MEHLEEVYMKVLYIKAKIYTSLWSGLFLLLSNIYEARDQIRNAAEYSNELEHPQEGAECVLYP